MSNYTHQTAPTQFVEAAGVRFAYRRFANRRFGVTIDIPLLFFMHFTGTMDHWDPALTDGFAQDREVILFNNAGVSSSSGEVPTSIEEMAQHAAAFIDALGVKKLDALGFSVGGLIAQQLTIDRPDLVRKLILVGTSPRSGQGMASLTPEAQKIFGAKYDPADELWPIIAPANNATGTVATALNTTTALFQRTVTPAVALLFLAGVDSSTPTAQAGTDLLEQLAEASRIAGRAAEARVRVDLRKLAYLGSQRRL
jgi:pimeloyl-ACP methyl ester carboxylesterase